jgi:HKD family nuclease
MSSQTIKALQTLLNQPADNCVALTYSLDLPFFEYMLFAPLYNGGCRNVAVLCDPGQHETALQDVPALEHVGQRYLCLPVTVARAAFHPKLLMLTSEQEGLLLLGSGNLTRAGLTHNQEVWTRFGYDDDSPDEFARAAFRGAFDYLSRLAESEGNPLLRERLQQLWQTTAWLSREPVQPEDANCWSLHNLDRPIMDQLVELWAERDGSAVLEATVVSPYFDKGALAFAALLERLRPDTISLITEHEAPGLDPEVLRRMMGEHGARLTSKRLELGARRLHAKTLALRTGRGSWLLTGSPNFSRPALLRSARDGNAELAVLRYEPDLSYLDLTMSPVSDTAVPLELAWSPSAEETDEAPDDQWPTYRTVRAEFSAGKLSVAVEP